MRLAGSSLFLASTLALVSANDDDNGYFEAVRLRRTQNSPTECGNVLGVRTGKKDKAEQPRACGCFPEPEERNSDALSSHNTSEPIKSHPNPVKIQVKASATDHRYVLNPKIELGPSPPMLELVAELGTASSLLSDALDRYLNACAAIQSYYTHSSSLDVPPILASCVANESDSAPSHAHKLKKAHAIINKAQNFSTCHAPVHLLPSEILARIFHMVVGTTCGIDADGPKSRSMPCYPDYLTHVCTRWRREAIKLPTLWTHIDLVYYHSSDRKFVQRAEVFAQRARDLPLDVHVRNPRSRDNDHSPSEVYKFVRAKSDRIRAFEWASPSTVNDFECWYFEGFCRFLDPDVLEEFTITDRGTYVPNYIYAADMDEEDMMVLGEEREGLRVIMPSQKFEDLLFPVRILRLEGVYPLWDSGAYHDLVELRLSRSSREDYSIGLMQLHRILESSPNLAVLHFALLIDNTVSPNLPPIQLPELRELNLGFLFDPANLEKFLSILAPCPKPLQLAMWIETSPLQRLLADSSISRFLKGSNVETFCLGGPNVDQILGSEHLPVLLPHLRTLALHRVKNQVLPQTYAKIMKTEYPAGSYALKTIYLQKSSLRLDYLRHLLKRCSVEAIVLWGCWVSRDNKDLAPDELVEELSALSPIVKCVDYDVDYESPTRAVGAWV